MVRIDKDNEKTRNILLFAGGFMAGFAFKMAIESDMFNELKNNALDMVDNYFNHEVEYVDMNVDDNDIVESDAENEDIKEKVNVEIE